MVLITEYFDPHVNPYWAILRQVGVEGAISKLDRRFEGEWNNSGDRPWDYTVLYDMKRRYERHDLPLLGIEDYPPSGGMTLTRFIPRGPEACVRQFDNYRIAGVDETPFQELTDAFAATLLEDIEIVARV